MSELNIIQNAPNLAELIPSGQLADDELPRDRSRGVMLGLAAGNLLGLPVEGDWYHDIDAMYPDGVDWIDPFELHRPMDDDLAQAVELAEALVSKEDLVSEFGQRLIVWLRENGRGRGRTTRSSILNIEKGMHPHEAARQVYETWGRWSPNGGVMRCAPVALARLGDPDALARDSASTCAVTHYSPTCQWSCIVINAVIALLTRGQDIDLSAVYTAAIADGATDMARMAERDDIPTDVLDAVAAGNETPADMEWMRRNQNLIGHTLLAMQVGLWAAKTPLGFKDALVAVIGAGGDTDTNGAVAGAVLGARYGASAIPQDWLEAIPKREHIENLADRLVALNGI